MLVSLAPRHEQTFGGVSFVEVKKNRLFPSLAIFFAQKKPAEFSLHRLALIKGR